MSGSRARRQRYTRDDGTEVVEAFDEDPVIFLTEQIGKKATSLTMGWWDPSGVWNDTDEAPPSTLRVRWYATVEGRDGVDFTCFSDAGTDHMGNLVTALANVIRQYGRRVVVLDGR